MRLFAAAALVVCAACHHSKPVAAAPPPVPPVASPPDAGPAASTPQEIGDRIQRAERDALREADPAASLLAAARMRKSRAELAMRAADPDTAAVSQDALACTADAHRSWAAQFPAAAAALDGTHAAADVYAMVGAPGAEALYLEAVCSAIWARMQGFTPLIERRNELTAELERVIQLAPDLDGGGPERELGTLLAALPSYAGGDLADARKRLESAIQRAPNDARNHLAMARTVAVKAQDRELFERELALVKKADDPLAAAEADRLLQREDDLFGPREK